MLKKTYTSLCSYLRIAFGSGEEETYELDLKNFTDSYGISLAEAYYHLKALELNERLTFNEKTFQRYRITDLSTKKKNTIESFIYIEGEDILTDRMGYPQFFTQLLFKKDSKDIFIKTVINNEEGVTKISSCKNLERYKKER